MAPSADEWLGVCRRASAGLRTMLAEHPTTADRAVYGGRGEGGDRSLVIDLAAEEIIFAELDALHAAGARFAAISEERGAVDYGDPGVLVVIDPIDGSLNAKRRLPAHSFSFAVAEGTTMADVAFGFVYDFGTNEEWTATRGAGATLNEQPLDPTVTERRAGDGRLELLGLESADPRWIAQIVEDLVPLAYRVRAMGSLAITLCQVAGGRLDAMTSLKRSRSVDVAAAQLIVREAGGLVTFPAFDPALSAPLDLVPHSDVVAARTPETLSAVVALLTG